MLPKIDISTFTGRDEELRQLEAQLLNASGEKVCSIAGLSGSGGMGKSALAFHFATVYRERFPDGVIGLPVDGKAAHEIAREFARRCGEEIDEEDNRSAATIMQEVFAHRQMLLIFDNADRADLKSLRPGGQRCALIVTTRDRRLPNAFDIPDGGIIDLPPLPDEDARQLLRRILGSERVDAELEAVDLIIAITGGLPLALQIIGAALRGRQRNLTRYAEALQQEQTRLQRLQDRDDQDLNVTASLNLSLKSLEDTEIDLFACLSVCAKDGFSLQTAMVAGGLVDEWEAQYLLDRLYQLSLLNEVSADCYVFHALVRVYAGDRARERDLWEIAAQRHANYFIDLVQSNNVESPEIAKQLAENFNDVLQAAQWLRGSAISEDRKAAAFQFALNLRPFLLKYSYSKQAIELMMGFQEWAEQLNDWYASVRFKIQHAKYLAIEGQLSEAEAILESAQDSIERIRDPIQRQESQLKQLNSLGGVLRKQRDFEKAIATFEREITISEASNDQEQVAIGLHGLGMVFLERGNLGDLDAAIAAFERSIAIAETLNDQTSLAIGLNRLGRLLEQQNKFEKAISAFERSIVIAETMSDQTSLAIGLNCLAGALQKQDKFEEAIAAFKRLVSISEAINDQKRLAVTLNRLGGVFQKQGDLKSAISAFEREISIDRELDDQRQLVIGLNCLGRVLQRWKKNDEATATFKEQIDVAEALNDQRQVAIGWGCLGDVYQDQKNFGEAIVAFQHEIHIEETLDNWQQLVFAYNRLGKVFEDQDNLEGAVDAFNQSIEIASEFDDKLNWAVGLDCLGRVLKKQDKLKEAAIAFEEEINLAETLSNIRQLAIGWNSLGEVAKEQGYLEKSIFAFLRAATYNESLEDEKQLHSIWKRLGNILSNKKHVEAANAALRRFNLMVNDLSASLYKSTALHTLGKAYNTVNKLGEAEIILRESQEWFDEANNHKQLLKVLKTLGETFEKKQDWKQAEQILHLSYNETEKIKDISLREKIVRKLGEICMKQETEEKIIYAKSCFRYSVKLSLEMNDPIRLAQVYKAWGDALRYSGKLKDSVSVLVEGFEKLISDIENHGHKSGKYIGSLQIIAKVLGYTLISLRRQDEVLKYCDRAITATNNAPQLVELRNKLENKRTVVKLRDRR